MRKPIVKPGEWLGIIGGGQLARMMIIAAAGLGIGCIVLTDEEDCPAAGLAGDLIVGDYRDATLLDTFSRKCAAVTLEFENIPLSTLSYIAARTHLYPHQLSLAIAQNRLSEKAFFKGLNIDTAPFAAISFEGDLRDCWEKISKNSLDNMAILKTRQFGYDGKGQIKVHDLKEAMNAYYDMKEQPAVLEGFVDFNFEFSILGVRSVYGEFDHYAPIHNIHRNHILKQSIVPATLDAAAHQKAVQIVKTVMEKLHYVGVLAIEFFLTHDGQVVVNEMAPRVHNSGHWTLDACQFSQFEQHVRAVCGWNLGTTAHHASATMTNLIGDDILNLEKYMDDPKTSIHVYGKTEVRAGRKMGHVTQLA